MTTDRTRLYDYYNALTTNPAKRAEFSEVLREVDDCFVTYLLRIVPREPKLNLEARARCLDMTIQ